MGFKKKDWLNLGIEPMNFLTLGYYAKHETSINMNPPFLNIFVPTPCIRYPWVTWLGKLNFLEVQLSLMLMPRWEFMLLVSNTGTFAKLMSTLSIVTSPGSLIPTN